MKKISVCSLSGRNARGGSVGRDLATESSHGREKGITPFASAAVGKRTNRNRRCEVPFMNDLRSSAPQSPAQTGYVLVSVIGDGVGRLNCTLG